MGFSSATCAFQPLIFLPLVAAAAFFGPLAVQAQLPENVLLLVNADSPASKTIANHFRALRDIPPEHVVWLTLPSEARGPHAEISPDVFMRDIWLPVQEALRERHLENQMMAWVYSADFPVRCLTQPPMSLQGMTFLRGQSVPAAQVEQGRFVSGFFNGPSKPSGLTGESRAFERHPLMGGREHPVPSMMLGYTGARGNEVASILACLKRGRQSDGSSPTGTVYFVTSQDVRSKCRAWQYPMAEQQLESLGGRVVIAPQFPASGAQVLGLMAGSPWVNPFALRGHYLDGAMAEHLTSAAAYFHDYDQTKLSSWIHAGATASAGTVSEPMAIWMKFPSASFFVHYLRGCTMMESFYQSVACPLQLLLVGDPLAQPFRHTSHVTVTLTETEDALWAEVVRPEHADMSATRWSFFLDGKHLPDVEAAGKYPLPRDWLADGYHRVTVWGYGERPGGIYWRGTTHCVIRRHGRSAAFSGMVAGDVIDADHTRKLQVTAEGSPVDIGVRANGRIWARGPADAPAALEIKAAELGLGPVELVPVAWYADGMEVRGEPVPVELRALNRAPQILGVVPRLEADGALRIVVNAEEPDDDPVRVEWGERIEPSAVGADAWRVVPEGREPSFVLLPGHPQAREYSAELKISLDDSGMMRNQEAGLLFNFQKKSRWGLWGLFGGESAWVLGERQGKAYQRTKERGAFIRPERWHRLRLRRTDTGVEAHADGVRLFRETNDALDEGRLGLFARREAAEFRNVTVIPPPNPGIRVEGETLIANPDQRGRGRQLVVRVSDGLASTERLVPLDRLFADALRPDE